MVLPPSNILDDFGCLMLARRLTESCLNNVVSVSREFFMQRIVEMHKAGEVGCH